MFDAHFLARATKIQPGWFRDVPSLDIVGGGLHEGIKNFCTMESKVITQIFTLSNIETGELPRKYLQKPPICTI